MSEPKLGQPGARLQCPRRSRFYVCDKNPGRFIGCCNLDPCATDNGICPHDYLEPTGFEQDAFPWISPQSCGDDDDDNTHWYTCTKPVPAFMGCCAVNPCTMRGCPLNKLRAARLSAKKENADVFLHLSSATATSRPSPSTAATSSATAAASSQAPAVSASAAPTQRPGSGSDNPQDSGSGTPKGIVAGIAVASAIGGILILLFLLWLKRTIKRSREMRERDNPPYSVVQPFQNSYPFSPESLGPGPSIPPPTLLPGSQVYASGTASGQVTPLPSYDGHSRFIPQAPVELPAIEPARLGSMTKKETGEKTPKADEGVEMQPAELADTSRSGSKESNLDNQ